MEINYCDVTRGARNNCPFCEALKDKIDPDHTMEFHERNGIVCDTGDHSVYDLEDMLLHIAKIPVRNGLVKRKEE